MNLDRPIDTERFILEIKERPTIWDMDSKEYCDRDIKKNSWSELVQIFIQKQDANEAELNDFGRVLQRKWKSLRDCYVRECRRISKVKAKGIIRKTQYVYYKQLSFLSPFVKTKSTSTNDEEKAGDIKEEIDANVVEPVSTGNKRRKLNKMFGDNEEIVNIHKTGFDEQLNENNASESDCDRLFLLSLLNHLKEVPQQNRFTVKMQIMQVIDQARQTTNIPVPVLSNNSSFTWQNPSVPCMQFYPSQPPNVAFTPNRSPSFHGKKRRTQASAKTSQRNLSRHFRKQQPVEPTPLTKSRIATSPQSVSSLASDQSVESDASEYSVTGFLDN